MFSYETLVTEVTTDSNYCLYGADRTRTWSFLLCACAHITAKALAKLANISCTCTAKVLQTEPSQSLFHFKRILSIKPYCSLTAQGNCSSEMFRVPCCGSVVVTHGAPSRHARLDHAHWIAAQLCDWPCTLWQAAEVGHCHILHDQRQMSFLKFLFLFQKGFCLWLQRRFSAENVETFLS